MGKSSFLQEFKAFAMKGNVIDMAVGVIIGGAFGKIVMFIKLLTKLTEKKKEEAPAVPPAPPVPSKEEVLLTEIRDLLKEK